MSRFFAQSFIHHVFYTIVNIALLVVALSSDFTAAMDKRIVGGTVAPDGQYPYMVSLRIATFHYCGGSILTTTSILTAASCLNTLSPIVAWVGTNSLSTGGTSYPVQSFIKHPMYDPNGRIYDAGIVKTTTITFSAKIQPIALTPLLPIEGNVVVITGWGSTSSSSSTPLTDLMVLNTITLSKSTCQSLFLGTGFTVSPTHMCTIKPLAGACVLDEGDPVVVCNVQFGIVSIRTCAAGYPDLYTTILSVYGWIVANI